MTINPFCLDQADTWRGQDLDAMTPSHRANTLAWILRNADRLQAAYAGRMLRLGDFPEELWEELDEPAETWIRSKPLVVELARRDAARSWASLAWTPIRNRLYFLRRAFGPRRPR